MGKRRQWLAGWALLTILLTSLPLAWAQAPGAEQVQAETAAEDRGQAFQAVEGAVQEDVPGGPLLIGAYAVIWLLVFGYVFRLLKLQRKNSVELEHLRRALDEAAGSPSEQG